MSTQLPEPDINTASHINTRIVGYTADKVRQYAADETKRLTDALQSMTAERDALKADAEQYRKVAQMAVEMIETNAHERRHVRWALIEAMKGTS